MAAESGTENPVVDFTPDGDQAGFPEVDTRSVSRAGDTDEARKYQQVLDLLRTVPYQFQFFQAVRLLERLQPGRRSVGRFATPGAEIVRFAATPRMAFPASQIQGLAFRGPEDEEEPPVMMLNFMGMTGPMGVLPLYYTEMVLDRMRHRDKEDVQKNKPSGMSAFLDMFNHRMVSLFYQAWEKYRATVAYERDERDRFSHMLLDTLGMGATFLQSRQIIGDDSFLFYSGILGIHTRPAEALRQILSDYFDVPVEIEQLVGAWHALEENDQCLFDKANSYSEQVGMGAIVGDEIWDQQSGVRVRIGPLTMRQYLDFLPTGTAHRPLKALLRFFSGWEIDYEIQLVLKRQQVPGCKLGDESEAGPKLGWVSWAKNVDMERDPDDAILRV